MTKEFKTYERLIVVTNDEYLYGIFGEDDREPMVINKESIEYLEDYLYDYDESDEEDEPKMNDEDVKGMYNFISDKLREYKEIQVVYKD